MKYFLIVWIGSHLLYGPEHPARYSTADDCRVAAMQVGNAAFMAAHGVAKGENVPSVEAACYDQNGNHLSYFGRTFQRSVP